MTKPLMVIWSLAICWLVWDAVGDGDQLDAVALEPAVEPEGLDEIAREARQIFDEDDGERWGGGQRGGHEALVRRPVLDAESRPGGVLVHVLAPDLPAHAVRKLAAGADLVLEGGGALHVRAEAGVDRARLHEALGVSAAFAAPCSADAA